MDTFGRGLKLALPNLAQSQVHGDPASLANSASAPARGRVRLTLTAYGSGPNSGEPSGRPEVLSAMREVTQVILGEGDRGSLIRRVCASLVETRGYDNAWIVILNDHDGVEDYAACGNEQEAEDLVRMMRQGGLPSCISTSMVLRQLVVCDDRSGTCSNCSIGGRCATGGGISVPILCRGGVCGFLTISADSSTLHSPDERHLLQETADNLGLAMRRIRAESQRAEAEQALRESQRLLSTLMSNLPGMVYRCRNDKDWTLEFASDGALALTGYSARELVGTKVTTYGEIIHPEDRDAVWAGVQQALEEKRGFQLTYRIRRASGEVRWVWEQGCGVYSAAGDLVALEGFITDITDRRKAEERLKHDALHDPLTGLANRTHFLSCLRRVLERSRRQPQSAFAVLFLDFDEFKTVNDTHGHLVGDELLVALARRLERCVRPGDIVARQGGDEFTILLQAIDEIEDATLIAERVREALAEPCTVMDHSITLSASIGIAIGGPNYITAEDILHDADVAMYRTKARNRAVRETDDRRIPGARSSRQVVEADLPHALERNELVLHYQPLVALRTRHVVGFESLLRWRHPTLGQILPESFLPLARQTGLIVPIGRWALCEAWQQVSGLMEESASTPLVLNVNVSAPELAHPELRELIGLLMDGTFGARHRPSLQLEIGRDAFATHDETLLRRLAAIPSVSLNVQITDPSDSRLSVSALAELPVRTLRLHRDYAERAAMGEGTVGVLKSLVDDAHEHGCTVVAEGIETSEQADFFTAAGCDHGQGYYFGAPMGRESLGTALSRTDSSQAGPGTASRPPA